jgi:hypothetical protein
MVNKNIKISDMLKASPAMRRQVKILKKLQDWHRRSAQTHWVIGEYLEP